MYVKKYYCSATEAKPLYANFSNRLILDCRRDWKTSATQRKRVPLEWAVRNALEEALILAESVAQVFFVHREQCIGIDFHSELHAREHEGKHLFVEGQSLLLGADRYVHRMKVEWVHSSITADVVRDNINALPGL